MTTIVSAFISNVNLRKDRDITTYYSLGKCLLQSTTPKIIFLDETMYNLIVKNTEYNKDNTCLIKYNKENIYLYEFIHQLTYFSLDTDNPCKDTIEYMFAMCNKTEFMTEAITADPFQSKNFIWVDFGIRHVFTCSDTMFIEKLNHLHTKQYNKVRIASIWDLKQIYRTDLMKQISWYFAGGVFGGDHRSLLEFADLMKIKCIQIMNTYHTIVWEVNIWYMIYRENPELFEPYKCNHTNTIIENY